MFHKIFFITNLLLTILKTNCNKRLEINKNSIAIFRPIYPEFRINNIKYREGINPLFVMNFRPGIYNVSEYPLSVYPSWAKYGNNYFKNSLIKTDWKIIDKINFNLHKDSIVNIIVSSYNPHFYNISKMNNIEYKIYHNHEQLYSTNYPSFDFISKYHFNKGPHLLTLMAKTNDVACLCPTIGDGFKSGHHFAIWENTIENKRNNIPIKITLPIYHKENNVIKIDNFNVGVKYNLNLFTK
jgi:hypothetical protein